MKLSSLQFSINDAPCVFSFREDSVGDRGVVRQIFQDQDYNFSHWPQGRRLHAYHQAFCAQQTALIIDAGANIGASTVYFSRLYANSRVFAIEPDRMNWHLLEINTAGQPNVHNFHGAIADTDGELELVDPGRSDWGFTTRPVDAAAPAPADAGPTSRVKSICPASILAHPFAAGAVPLICKIDIEGGEDALFRGDVSWLDRFAVVIIELHDWMLPFSGSSRNFLKAALQFDFDFLHRGENVFLFNRRLLAP